MKSNFICFATSICLGVCAFSQVVKIDEVDINDKTWRDVRFADVNSSITLRIDTTALLQKISKTGSAGLPRETVALLDILTEAFAKRNEMIESFHQLTQQFSITGDSASKAQQEQDFVNAMQRIAGEIVALFDKDPLLEQYYVEQADDLRLMEPIYTALQRRIREIERELLLSPAYDEIRIQLGGWLIHKGTPSPLHFEGLDNNPASEYTEVERWKFMPTPEQLQELEQLQQLARANKAAEANLPQILTEFYMKNFSDFLEDKLSSEAKAFESEANTLLEKLGASEIKAIINQILEDAKAFIKKLKERVAFYSGLRQNTNLAGLLSSVNDDIRLINETQKQVKEQFKKLKQLILAAAPAIREKCKELLVLAEKRLLNLAREIPATSLIPGLNNNSLADEALAFTDKVLSLSIKQLPDEIKSDLHYAGARESGDRLVIKLLVKKENNNNPFFQESRSIGLQMILPHVEGTVGVIFAHPLKTTSISKDFQMAPYYNLLYKGLFHQKWKRKSSLANNLWDISIGLHISSPDFNKDDVPELGLGLVTSFLHDYVQFGWAYNVFEPTGYLFFGLRLPVPSMNFGGNSPPAAVAQ